MMFRSTTIAALTLMVACGPARPTADAGSGGGTTTGGGTATGGGAAGGGSAGGGSAGGGAAGGGAQGDAGVPETIQAAKAATYPALVNIKGVVVTAVSFSSKSTAGNCPNETSAGVTNDFWVADPANPQVAIFVQKFRCDFPVDYDAKVGDVLDIKGVVGFESTFTDRSGYRITLKSQFSYISNRPQGYNCLLTSTPPCQPIEITKKGTMAPIPAIDVPETFGDGGLHSNADFGGARIHVPGPLTITDPSPLAMKRISALPNDTRYFGFQLSNGMYVNNYRTFATFDTDGGVLMDGGTSPCDYRLLVLDGGSLSLPNGMVGVWDTYTHAFCQDGGTASNCFRNRGVVPGIPDANYTYVLYPTTCADFAP